jgi:hypothetical protein
MSTGRPAQQQVDVAHALVRAASALMQIFSLQPGFCAASQ